MMTDEKKPDPAGVTLHLGNGQHLGDMSAIMRGHSIHIPKGDNAETDPNMVLDAPGNDPMRTALPYRVKGEQTKGVQI